MNRPSGATPLCCAKRRGGSQAVIADSGVYPPNAVRTTPPAPGLTSFRPMNPESMPGPVAIACHTCSGLAGTSASLRPSNSCPISAVLLGFGLAARDAGMDRDDDAVSSAARGVLVVVLADQAGDRVGQLGGELGPVGRVGE